jgi:hypothetical protein
MLAGLSLSTMVSNFAFGMLATASTLFFLYVDSPAALAA